MNKTAIKNFAIWARNKLIADVSYKAGLLGITEKGMKTPLPQSSQTVQFFDIGTKEPSSITVIEIQQRKKLVEEIERKAKQSDYTTAYKNVIEEVAYTWFNRLIAIRFMEVNDYLPTRIRVLSSESNGKAEPDLVTHALEANLDYSAYEKDRIIQLKHENKLDELFRILFIKQCNALNANLPDLFEKTSDYTELLLNVSFTDKEGVVHHLVNDLDEDDFNVSKEGQVEIIGWLYQYYNTEPKDETFALLKKNVKITKERIPAATQLFTPDWIVRYMVENSLGRFWIEGHPNEELKSNWKYYLDEVEQEEDVQRQLKKIREEYKIIKPEDIKIIDPAMGSGHILVYAFDVLMQIYESYGYSQRDAAKSIIENNLYGLDIDNRAYQLAYFGVMMKARQYNRRILNGETKCHVYAIQESNGINRNQLKYFGDGLSEMEKNTAILQIQGLFDAFIDAKDYGSILTVEKYNWELLRKFIDVIDADGQLSLETINIEHTRDQIYLLIEIGEVLARKYDVVVTNPPYLNSSGMNPRLSEYVKLHYADTKADMSTVFMNKTLSMCNVNGFMSMINIPVWMFITSFENFRGYLLRNTNITNMLHNGRGVFGSDFGSVAFVFRNSYMPKYLGIYKRLFVKVGDVESNEKKQARFFSNDKTFLSNTINFSKISGTPIAYWASNTMLNAFQNNKLGDLCSPVEGIKTGENEVFLRLWFEVNINKSGYLQEFSNDSNKVWCFTTKGGAFRKWYGNIEYVIDWTGNGEKLGQFKKSSIYKKELWSMPAITWTYLTAGSVSFRSLGKGYLYNNKGPAVFGSDISLLHYIMSMINSKVGSEALSYICSTLTFLPGDIKKLPIIIDKEQFDNINSLTTECIKISRIDWDSFETSRDFSKHPFVKTGSSIELEYSLWEKECSNRFNKLKNNEEQLNRIFISIYDLQDEMTPEVVEKDVSVSKAQLGRDIRSFISYAVGCMFGRYSLDVDGIAFAGGEWSDNKYESFVPDKDNILPITDDVYFKDDIVGFFIEFIKKVYSVDTLERNLEFIANALGTKGNDNREKIRNYFLSDFYNDHCAMYSVSGSGKRPIYWLFDSGKQNGFKALVYMHRYDENTIGNIRIDYLHRMQRIYENEIGRMQDTIENSKDVREVTAATKRKEKLIKQLQETKEYDEKIAHLALARTSIDLDDGVKVNYEKVQTDRDGKKLDVLAKI